MKECSIRKCEKPAKYHSRRSDMNYCEDHFRPMRKKLVSPELIENYYVIT